MSILGYTNTALLDTFKNDLDQYETAISSNSNNFLEYQTPSTIIARALDRLFGSIAADVYSMMSILITHIKDQKDGAYSEFTLNMLASSAPTEKTKQSIVMIMSVTRQVILGNTSILNDNTLPLSTFNLNVFTFLMNYTAQYDPVFDLPASNKSVQKTSFQSKDVLINLADKNLDVRLTSDVTQTVKCTPTNSFINPTTEDNAEAIIILTPNVSTVILDKSLSFHPHALSQALSLGCLTSTYSNDSPTSIKLPALFCSVWLRIMTYDKGTTLHVTEFKILPPSVNRFLA